MLAKLSLMIMANININKSAILNSFILSFEYILYIYYLT